MFIQRLVCAILVCILTGCISTKRTSSIVTVYDDISIATTNVKPLVSLSYGTSQRILIEENVSPKIKLNFEEETDYFEVISIDGKKGQAFNLEVSALCDCLGFRKWGVLPDSFLISPEGQQVGVRNNTSIDQIRHTGNFPMDGKYKLMVIAKSKYVGQKIGDVKGYLPNTSTISLPVTVHPTGTVIVWWLKNNI